MVLGQTAGCAVSRPVAGCSRRLETGTVAVRVVVVACGAAALALVSGAAALTKHPQLLGVDRTGGTVLLDPWTGQSQPYRAAVAAEEPFFSPDGMRVAFTKKVRVADSGGERTFAYELWVARWDGSMARLLSRYGDDPTWSPDGRTIAFTWTGPDPTLGVRAPPGIYLVSSEGGTARRVLPPVVGIDSVGDTGPMVPDFLTWSPDGRWIAFEAGNGGMWVVHPDGSRARALASPHNGPSCGGRELARMDHIRHASVASWQPARLHGLRCVQPERSPRDLCHLRHSSRR
jgi:Tol biopolymer transport system component